MSPMKFALIGTGNIAVTYVKAAKKCENAEIAAVVSRSKERAQSFAGEHGIPESSDRMDGIEGDFESVIVATPNGLHWRDTCVAAALGKHVLTEKPLDISMKSMERMILTCKETGVTLGVAYQHRFHPVNKAIKELLERGALGQVLAVDVSAKFYRGQKYYDSADWRGTWDIDGGGPFMQQGAHTIDLMGWFFGKPKTIIAKTATLAHTIAVEDHGVCIMEFENRALGTLTASTITKPGYNPRIEVFTDKGSFILVNNSIVEWNIDGIENPGAAGNLSSHSGASSAAVADTSLHELAIQDFVAAVAENRAPFVNGEEASRATEIILAVYESAGTGSVVSL
ncbi:MAG: gfo/Idh/MocA family oxidoreductase [Chitinivibrionales bacterium]|nr:gfo/Idh/MocA family oxidoreductase [Chitinivibrionales bacterium]